MIKHLTKEVISQVVRSVVDNGVAPPPPVDNLYLFQDGEQYLFQDSIEYKFN
jgi:hypothetical protein